MADETKRETTPVPIAILEWTDGDAGLVCTGPACAFGADVMTATSDGRAKAETQIGKTPPPAGDAA